MEEIIIVGFGLIVGSFLNVLIYRLPRHENIVFPRSHCPACNTAIKFYDNVPVISYLVLMGKCRQCKARISFRYPLVELLTALGFWLSYAYFGYVLHYVGVSILFICLLVVLAFIDLEHKILPLQLTIGGAVVFLAYSFFNPFLVPREALIASAGGALAFTAIYFFYLKVRRIEGLGQGDIWMILMMGAFLGITKLVISILLATTAGLLVGLYFIIFKRKTLKMELPFGTFLSLGAFISLFMGHDIMHLIHSIYH